MITPVPVHCFSITFNVFGAETVMSCLISRSRKAGPWAHIVINNEGQKTFSMFIFILDVKIRLEQLVEYVLTHFATIIKTFAYVSFF